jgi:acyl-CoA thioesterase
MSGAITGGQQATFDAHTAVEDDRMGAWQAHIPPELSGFGSAHGGYVAAVALRAMARLVDDPERAVRSLGVQLLAPITPGPLELLPRLERTGSSMSAATLLLEQGGETVGNGRALFGAPRSSPDYLSAQMPRVPPPENCQPLREKPAPDALAGLLVEHRPAAPPLPLSGGERAEILVWMRPVEDRPLDALALTMLADAAPPALFGHLTRFVPIPSVEITSHFAAIYAAASSPWVLGVFRTCHAAKGYAIEDGELWTPRGHLALQARQLCRILGAVPNEEATSTIQPTESTAPGTRTASER